MMNADGSRVVTVKGMPQALYLATATGTAKIKTGDLVIVDVGGDTAAVRFIADHADGSVQFLSFHQIDGEGDEGNLFTDERSAKARSDALAAEEKANA